jgi:class 3 adenylate cyclase
MRFVGSDTVNTRRMESHGEVGKIQISDATYDLLGMSSFVNPKVK